MFYTVSLSPNASSYLGRWFAISTSLPPHTVASSCVSMYCNTYVAQVDDIVLPHRPNYGKMGKACVVTANHYKADYNRGQLLYQYDVSLEGFDKTALVSFCITVLIKSF